MCPLYIPVVPSAIHSLVIGAVIFLCLGHYEPPRMTQIPLFGAFLSLYAILSLFPLESTFDRSISHPEVHPAILQ